MLYMYIDLQCGGGGEGEEGGGVAECLGDVDDGVQYLGRVGGVQGRLGPCCRHLQTTFEFELGGESPPAHCGGV